METQSEVEHTGRMKEEDTRTCLTEPDRFEDGEWLTEHQTCRLGPGSRLDSLLSRLRKDSRHIQIGDCIISLINPRLAWNRAKSKTGLFRSYSRQRSKSLRGRIPAPGACAGPNGFGIKKILFGWEYLTAENKNILQSFDTINVNRCLFKYCFGTYINPWALTVDWGLCAHWSLYGPLRKIRF